MSKVGKKHMKQHRENFKQKNSTKPSDYLVQAVWQNCPARNTIHIAICFENGFLDHCQCTTFQHKCSKHDLHVQKQNISTASLKNSTERSRVFPTGLETIEFSQTVLIFFVGKVDLNTINQAFIYHLFLTAECNIFGFETKMSKSRV